MDTAEDSVLLESVIAGESLGRNSFLARDPSATLKGREGQFLLRTRSSNGSYSEEAISSTDPLLVLEDKIGSFKQATDPRLPSFQGGAIGFLAYDAIRYYEVIPDSNHNSENHPDTYFGIYHDLIVIDHIDHTVKVVSNAYVPSEADLETAYNKSLESIRNIEIQVFQNPQTHPSIVLPANSESTLELDPVMGDDQFKEAVEKAKEYIFAGDIFQVVPSRKVRFKPEVPAFQIYRALRAVNPSPYMYFMKLGCLQIVGSSPEILVKHTLEKTTLRPIAGTRHRGKNHAEDEALAKDLLADQKEISEHIMLVDLGRNDLGRISEAGSVVVEDFKNIEKYSHVMHIVSQCVGKIREGKSVYDVIRATIPAGTVSGAPKIRAMEIIDELENNHRGIFSGGLGYISFAGEMDIAIIIRTIILDGDIGYLQAGGGIVYDSDPEAELQETKNKMAGMLKAVEFARHGLKGELK